MRTNVKFFVKYSFNVLKREVTLPIVPYNAPLLCLCERKCNSIMQSSFHVNSTFKMIKIPEEMKK